jgi:hypothetical protein
MGQTQTLKMITAGRLYMKQHFGVRFEIVKLLLERGADPLIADNDWLIPLDYAKDSAIRSLLKSATRNNELRDSFGLTDTTLKPNLRA